MKKKLTVAEAIEKAGGVAVVARAIGRDESVVWRWWAANELPGAKYMRKSREIAKVIARLADCDPERLTH